jgi:hypothetical protein
MPAGGGRPSSWSTIDDDQAYTHLSSRTTNIMARPLDFIPKHNQPFTLEQAMLLEIDILVAGKSCRALTTRLRSGLGCRPRERSFEATSLRGIVADVQRSAG